LGGKEESGKGGRGEMRDSGPGGGKVRRCERLLDRARILIFYRGVAARKRGKVCL